MFKFIKKHKQQKAEQRAEEWQKVKKRAFVNRLKNGNPPTRRPIMKVMGKHTTSTGVR